MKFILVQINNDYLNYNFFQSLGFNIYMWRYILQNVKLKK